MIASAIRLVIMKANLVHSATARRKAASPLNHFRGPLASCDDAGLGLRQRDQSDDSTDSVQNVSTRRYASAELYGVRDRTAM